MLIHPCWQVAVRSHAAPRHGSPGDVEQDIAGLNCHVVQIGRLLFANERKPLVLEPVVIHVEAANEGDAFCAHRIPLQTVSGDLS